MRKCVVVEAINLWQTFFYKPKYLNSIMSNVIEAVEYLSWSITVGELDYISGPCAMLIWIVLNVPSAIVHSEHHLPLNFYFILFTFCFKETYRTIKWQWIWVIYWSKWYAYDSIPCNNLKPCGVTPFCFGAVKLGF